MRVYALLSDVDKYPSWRPGVKSVTRQPDHDGKPAWTEKVGGDTIPLRFERMERPSAAGGAHRRSVAAVRRDMDVSHRAGAEAAARVTITEDGEVYNPIFRFMSRFVFGHAATLDEFVRDLEARGR